MFSLDQGGHDGSFYRNEEWRKTKFKINTSPLLVVPSGIYNGSDINYYMQGMSTAARGSGYLNPMDSIRIGFYNSIQGSWRTITGSGSRDFEQIKNGICFRNAGYMTYKWQFSDTENDD